MSLAAWLYEQCRALNVEFYFEKSVSDVDFEAGSILSGIQIRNASGDPNSVAGIPCKNLVLAAGPFTTGIFGKLFKNTPLELENHVQGSDWFHIKTSAIGSRAGAAFRFPRAAEFENRMNNEIYMITNPSDKTITISGTTTHIKNTDMNAERAQEPSRGKTSELKLVAAKHLNEAEIDLKKDNIVHRGRSELSVANGMRPIIDRVPASSIGLACKDEKEDCQPCGVWLCYGFGKFGTMLAPGAAKILVSKMFGGRSDSMVADDDFRLPRHQKPQVEGKGKAKV
jgi:glycine/D-amino acid oxidase-like deaminating enzyme